MRWLLLIFFPFALAVGFWAGSAIFPDLASKEMLRSVAGLFAIAWTVFGLALPKLSDLTGIEGLTEAERARLIDNVGAARAKIWRIGALSLACVMALIFLSVITSPENARRVAAFAGLIAGLGCAFLWAAKSGHDEIHEFTADVNQRRLATKNREEVLKRFANSNGG